jgi:transketolase
MRTAFVQALVDLADRDPSIVLLTGDLGYTVLEPFSERFPDRFFNVGVAEQNMLGLATGLAANGFKPYAYSIATFASMRPYEFLRNGAVLHQLPVRVVGIGSGVDYGHNGITHYALEDVAIMRVQPELAVVAPCDPQQTRAAILATAELPGPAYLRLGKDSAAVPGLNGRFRLGRAELIGDGTDLAIVTYGGIATEAVEAARLLAERGVGATVAVVASLAPAPVDDLAALLETVPVAVTLESHYVVGGVGSLVAEVVADNGLGCRVVRLGMREIPRGTTGEAPYLLDRNGLSAPHVAATALDALQGLRRLTSLG